MVPLPECTNSNGVVVGLGISDRIAVGCMCVPGVGALILVSEIVTDFQEK